MQWLFLAALILVLPGCLTAWVIIRAVSARNDLEMLKSRLEALELEVRQRRIEEKFTTNPGALEQKPVAGVSSVEEQKQVPIPGVQAVNNRETPPLVLPAAIPPVMSTGQSDSPETHSDSRQRILSKPDWEQFMGVKLFAWVGGLALFLGIVFFVKYSFDNDLVPPALRMAIGFLTGLGLMAGGIGLSKKAYPVLSKTLCATGIVILYAVVFACHTVYHFAWFQVLPTFLLMGLVTTAAFMLAVRLDALVVAVLGMLGGFLTPILLSTGQDNPLGLFGYIAVLDTGLILVALRKRWHFLVALSVLGTAVMEFGWVQSFFTAGRYFDGNKILIPFSVLFGFIALYLGACAWAKIRRQTNHWLSAGCFGLVSVALAFTGWFLSFESLAQRPWLMFSFLLVVDAAATFLVWFEQHPPAVHAVAGLSVFSLLGYWTAQFLTAELLNAGLVSYFVFSVLHSTVPVILSKKCGQKTQSWSTQVFPPLAIVLVLIPLLRLVDISFLVWPFVFVVDLLAVVLAALTFSLTPVFLVLILTLAATGVIILKIPTTLTGLPIALFLIGAFSGFFVMASVWLARRFKLMPAGESQYGPSSDFASELPSVSAILPFLLLIMAAVRLPLANPTPLFVLAFALVGLALGVARLYSIERLPAIGLACIAALEYAWHLSHFEPAYAAQTLAWYLVFLAVFTVFPFMFWKQFKEIVVPWAVAAMAAVPQFLLVYRLVLAAYPNNYMGALPAAFAAVPLLGLALIARDKTHTGRTRLTQLAWFGGVGLFFISLIFPIQFERQWLTIGWALEGVALLWLFHRLPHPGLRLTGMGLMLTAFIRLALNPVVLEYHARSNTPILNWYLYAYGVVAVCLYLSARLLAPPRHLVLDLNVPPLFVALGTILTFLLLNIEIADYFSEPGTTLTFQFSGNFARDMTYSIVWALFALVLLSVGILKKNRSSRYAGLGLLSLTLLKLFFHDLANLGQLYRIGALVGVALVAMLASFAYQRFFSSLENSRMS